MKGEKRVMRKRIAALLVGGALLCAAISCAFAQEMNGFHGIPWGAEFGTMKSGDFTKVFPFKGIAADMDSYQRKDDLLKFSGAVADSINYNFHKGRLVSVTIDFNGFYNYEGFYRFCTAEVGPVSGSMAKNMEMVTTFESHKTGALLFFQAGAPQFSFGRLFLYWRDWLH